MAASPALIFKEDGSIEATPELKAELRVQPGTRLELIERSGDEVRFRLPSTQRKIGNWRNLEGLLADSDISPNAESALERLKELEKSGQGLTSAQFRGELLILLGLWDGDPNTPVRRRELPPWNWVPNNDWRSLEGILADGADHDTTEMKVSERMWEEEHDARKFNPPLSR